ncbi:MAG: hypothetical protein HN352_03555 [Bacteroidetes bacterium]|nr:hypothetical protein [Bacteroidota bacterium]MBT4399059.1 hypothetical protein [Bacteroidota bacterium]MBT5426093.1 hypothetical protein [Bacteroidota bacterium]MBT7464090.1 hypothetical protein [Bacteroidota bacterium]
MKVLQGLVLVIIGMMAVSQGGYSQTDTVRLESDRVYVVTKFDGSKFVGKIISRDARDVLVATNTIGMVYIPKHVIRSIREVEPDLLTIDSLMLEEEIFSTRYFITTNGLPIDKGESYVQWNIFGPDFQFGLGKNLGVGVMSSWVGIPLIGSIKYAIPVSEKINFGLGALIGSATWADINAGGALPFAVLTYGDRRHNINMSAGYGAIWGDGSIDGSALVSISGMTRIGVNLSLVFDSFIVPRLNFRDMDKKSWFLLIPGIRWQTDNNKAWQFGFGGVITGGKIQPFPIPMIQWFKRIN